MLSYINIQIQRTSLIKSGILALKLLKIHSVANKQAILSKNFSIFGLFV